MDVNNFHNANPYSYIRIHKYQVLPRNDTYEATDKDLEFLEEYKKKTGDTFSIDAFEKLISLWEQRSDRDYPISFLTAKEIAEKIERGLKIDEIFNYWVKQRETFKRALIRRNMRPNPEDTSAYLAFRPREKEKMRLRRMGKTNDLEYLKKFQTLRYNLNFSKSLADKIKLRETIKADLIDVSIMKFRQEVNEILDTPNNSEWKHLQDKINKNLAEFKKINTRTNFYSPPNTDVIQDERIAAPPIIPPRKIIYPKPTGLGVETVETKNFDIASYIMCVVLDAEEKNITPDKIDNLTLLNPVEEKKYPEEPEPIIYTVPHPQPAVPPPKPTQPAKKSILPFKIRKRLARGNRLLIDRYLPETDEETNSSETGRNKILPLLKNELWKKKMQRFSEIYVFSDSEDEGHDALKIKKKSFKNDYNNFLKQNRVQLVKP